MFQQHPAKIELSHVSLILLGLMWTLPFLYSRHELPLTTFYQEWGAAMLGLCAMSLLLAKRQYLDIPRIALLPAGLILLVLVQYALGRVAYFSQALLVSLYWLWAALLIILGQRLREQFGLPALVTALAVFLLVGTELSALAGVVQHYSWRNAFTDRVVALKFEAGGLFGNLGQPNHFADYTALGLVSLGLLRARWQLHAWLVVPLAALLLFVLVLSGSRSAWLYLLFMAVMAFLWQRRDESSLPLWRYSLLLVPGFGLMHFAVGIPWLAGAHGSVTTMRRMLDGASGMGGMYGAGLLFAAAIALLWQRRNKSSRPASHLGLLLVLALVLVYFTLEIPLHDHVTAFEQLPGGKSGGDHSAGARLYLWREAWLIFTQYPLLGAGFGQFPWQHFLLGPSLHDTRITGIYGSAHNIVMQTVAEMGLAGLCILLGTLLLWMRQVRRAQPTIYHWWGYAIFAVLAIHSLLEYPLWYAYFLGVAALILGMMDNTTYRLKLQGAGYLSVAAMLLLGLLLMSQLWLGYRKLEVVAAPMPAWENDPQRVSLGRLAEIQGLQKLLLRSYIDLGVGEVGGGYIADRRALNESVMRFLPISPVAYREAILLAQAGLQAEAQAQMERAIWAYPEDFPGIYGQLNDLASLDQDPQRFPALLKFARQKNEERQRMAEAGNR